MSKMLTAEYGSDKTPLIVGDIEIPCYVLSDGTRVLSRTGFLRAIGRTGKAKGGRVYDDEFKTPVFLSGDNLQPYITKEILENSSPIPFKAPNGTVSIGYKAELLPDVLWAFADAMDAGKLKQSQLHIGQRAKMLLRAFTNVSII